MALVWWIRSNLTALHTFGMQDVESNYQSNDNGDPVPTCYFDEIEDIQDALGELLAIPKGNKANKA